MKYFFKNKIFVFTLSILFIFPNIAYAYLDPGTINVVFQVLAGFLGALLIFFNLVNKSIRFLLTKRIYSTILLVSIFIFPIWIFKSAFDIKSITFFLIILYFIPLILITFLLRNVEGYYCSKNLSKIQIFIISILFLYGLDLNIGFWSLLNYFPISGKNLYYFSLIFCFIFYLFIFALIKKSFLKYIFLIFVIIFSYNLISQDKSLNDLESKISFNNYEGSKIDIDDFDEIKKTNLFIILDEMSGIGGLDQNVINYNKAKSSFESLNYNHNLQIFENSYTIFPTTTKSIPSMLNFDLFQNKDINKKYIEDHDIYFFWKKLKINQLFSYFRNKKIYVRQTLSIDYCNNINVIRCDTFNPFSKKVLDANNYSNPIATDFFSKFSYQNLIFSRLLSRILAEFRIINLTTSPRSEKAYFEKDLDNLFNVMQEESYDLYFAHYLVPHRPFGYDTKCNYKAFKALNVNLDFMKIQHNNEIYCTNNFLNSFLEKLKKLEMYNNLNILIVSDHGSRISSNLKDQYSVVSMQKKNNQQNLIFTNIISVQRIVSNFFREEGNSINFENKYFDTNLNKFLDVDFLN